jgi:hypothetical protein
LEDILLVNVGVCRGVGKKESTHADAPKNVQEDTGKVFVAVSAGTGIVVEMT